MYSLDTIVVLDDSLIADEFGGGAYLFNRKVLPEYLKYFNIIYIPKIRGFIGKKVTQDLRYSITDRLLSLQSAGFQVPESIIDYFRKSTHLSISKYIKVLKQLQIADSLVFDNNFFPEFNESNLGAQLRSFFFNGEIMYLQGLKKIGLIQALGDRDVKTIIIDAIKFMLIYGFFSPTFLIANIYRNLKNLRTRNTILRQFKLILLTNAATKQLIRLNKLGNVKIMKYGVANEWSIEPDITSDRKYIFFNARLSILKGIIDLLFVLREMLKVKNVKILIAGSFEDDTSRRIFMRKVRELNLNDNIELMGFVSEDRLRELFLQSRVFIYPSHSDTYSISMLRALQCRVPVVAFDLVTLKSVYSGLPCVKFVRRFDYRNMARETLKILEMNESEYKKMCCNPKLDGFLFNHSSWENVTKEIVEILMNELRG